MHREWNCKVGKCADSADDDGRPRELSIIDVAFRVLRDVWLGIDQGTGGSFPRDALTGQRIRQWLPRPEYLISGRHYQRTDYLTTDLER